MNKKQSKKLNSHQKLIVSLSLIVVLLLAVCVTFAWYTNRIDIIRGTFTLGSYDYDITLFDVPVNITNSTPSSVGELTQAGSASYTREESDSWVAKSATDQTFQVDKDNQNWASESAMYQVVKIHNKSGFPIKAYEYLKYDDAMTSEQELLANNFYYKSVKLNLSGNKSAAEINTFLNGNLGSIPKPTSDEGGIAAYSSTYNFGKLRNNAIALDNNTIASGDYVYYLVGYCVNGLSEDQITALDNRSIRVTPVISIGQANAPNPQATGSAQTYRVDSWTAFMNALESAQSGDTINLERSMESPKNYTLSITNGVNLNLNGKDLTIHGNLVFNYKTGDVRTLTVPLASTLRVEGNLSISNLGAFQISGVSGSTNIKLGSVEDGSVVSGTGAFYADCGLSYTEGNAQLKPASVNEYSGLIIDGVSVQSIKDNGSFERATLTLNGSDTMVSLLSNAAIGTIEPQSNTKISNIYIVNYGTIGYLNLGKTLANSTTPCITYSQSNKVGVYVLNNNSINGIALPSTAKGYKTAGSTDYNTRLIDGTSARASFTALFSDSAYTNFKHADVESNGASSGSNSEVVRESTGVYTAYIRDKNNGTDWDISELFTESGYNVEDCTTLNVVNSYAYPMTEGQFNDIRDNFKSLVKLDLSSTIVDVERATNGDPVDEDDESGFIPDNALNVADSQAADKAVNLAEIALPIMPIRIGENAFRGTNIGKVEILSNVTEIGSNAFAVQNSIEVIWKSANAFPEYAAGFDIGKTIVFMDSGLVQAVIDGTALSDEWKLNIYEMYDFISGDYYCKEVTDGCSIIYYAGSIADNMNLVPSELTKQIGSQVTGYPVVSIGRQAFRKSARSFGGENGVTVNLSSCKTVSDYAFAGALKISNLSLGYVNRIGSNAFLNNTIINSNARPTDFGGMVSLGSNAFKNVSIGNGILDLHGPSEKYSPASQALASLTTSTDVTIDLSNCNTIPEDFSTGAELKGDITVRNSNAINAGAFAGAIIVEESDTPSNVIDARDVRYIGEKAFADLQCATFKIGTANDTIFENSTAYVSIIGYTRQTHKIGNFVVEGKFKSSQSAPAIASNDSDSEVVTIDLLTIERVTKTQLVNGVSTATVVATTIPQRAFASRDADNPNIIIKSLHIGYEDEVENEGEDDESHTFHYASYSIGNHAFYGTRFQPASADYLFDFQGVTTVGENAFANSNIVNLGLGAEITTIADQNFIAGCDNIRLLQIEKEGEIATLTGVSAADPKFSTSGTELQNFKIKVPYSLLPTYIHDTVWSGWKDYFDALYHTFVTNYNAGTTDSRSTPRVFKWSYNVFTDASGNKHAQIVKLDIIQNSNWSYTFVPGYNENSAAYRRNKRINFPNSFTESVNGTNVTYPVTEIGLEGMGVFDDVDVYDTRFNARFPFQLTIPAGIERIYAPAISSDSIGSFGTANGHFFTASLDTGLNLSTNDARRVLYYRRDNGSGVGAGESVEGIELVKVLSSYEASTFVIPLDVKNIHAGCFENCDNIQTVKLCEKGWTSSRLSGDYNNYDPKLSMIAQDAFKDADNITTFDLSSTRSFISLGDGALGEPRKLTVSSDGTYEYTAKQIQVKIPYAASQNADYYLNRLNAQYHNSTMYYLFSLFNSLIDVDVSSSLGLSVNSTTQQASAKLGLKRTEADVTLAGIQYHVMSSGTEYNGKVYSSDSSQFVAVVTGLSQTVSGAGTVVIPSTVSVKGISYAVVGITDTAFGANEAMTTLVLPNRNVAYSSFALSGCAKLGTIQYSDIVSYSQSAQTVADLPTPSAKSLFENESQEEQD